VLEADIKLKPGKYVVAVSGGVDSMVLLHLLAQKQKQETRNKKQEKKNQFQVSSSQLRLVVAHFNHGIRRESGLDEKFVQKTAKEYSLPIEVGYGHLGAGASEEIARKARYNFLFKIKEKHQANFIITAHHQDDLLETAILNLLRGTGRRGLSAISDNPKVLRPMLSVPKTVIVQYAKAHRLKWREDTTNKNDQYLRNYIRFNITNNLTVDQKQELLKNINIVAKNNKQANTIIAMISHNIKNGTRIDRQKFTTLPAEVANELIIFWLIAENFRAYNKKMVNRLSIATKTALPNTHHHVADGLELVIGKKFAWFNHQT